MDPSCASSNSSPLRDASADTGQFFAKSDLHTPSVQTDETSFHHRPGKGSLTEHDELYSAAPLPEGENKVISLPADGDELNAVKEEHNSSYDRENGTVRIYLKKDSSTDEASSDGLPPVLVASEQMDSPQSPPKEMTGGFTAGRVSPTKLEPQGVAASHAPLLAPASISNIASRSFKPRFTTSFKPDVDGGNAEISSPMSVGFASIHTPANAFSLGSYVPRETDAEMRARLRDEASIAARSQKSFLSRQSPPSMMLYGPELKRQMYDISPLPPPFPELSIKRFASNMTLDMEGASPEYTTEANKGQGGSLTPVGVAGTSSPSPVGNDLYPSATSTLLDTASLRTSRAEFRHFVLRMERDAAVLRESNVQQQSIIHTLQDALQQARAQIVMQEQQFNEEREGEKKEREAKFQEVLNQLRVVRKSAETLLGEKADLTDKLDQQKLRLLHLVEREREEKQRIMQEYRNETEAIIAKLANEVTQLRLLLERSEETHEFSQTQWAAERTKRDSELERLRQRLRKAEAEKEGLQTEIATLRGSLEAYQEQEAEGLRHAVGRLEGHRDYERVQEKNRELTQLVQGLERQLLEQGSAHEAHEAKLIESHYQERETLQERLAELTAERDAIIHREREAKVKKQAEVDTQREEKEKIAQELTAARKEAEVRYTKSMEQVAAQQALLETAWMEERQRLEELVEKQSQRLHSLEHSDASLNAQVEVSQHEKSVVTAQAEQKVWMAAAFAEHMQMESALLVSLQEELRVAQKEIYQASVASLQEALAVSQLSTRELEQRIVTSLQASHEEELKSIEMLVEELRVDLVKSQTMAAQYLKELNVSHREKEEIRGRLEGEVARLEKRCDSLQQELQYREMLNIELQSTVKMLTSRVENYESENRGLHEEVVELSKKLQEVHILLGRKDALINQLRAQLRAFASADVGGVEIYLRSGSTTPERRSTSVETTGERKEA